VLNTIKNSLTVDLRSGQGDISSPDGLPVHVSAILHNRERSSSTSSSSSSLSPLLSSSSLSAADAMLLRVSSLRPGARVIHVGKRGGCKSTPQAFIEKLLVAEAQSGKTVVRLKGGDPFVFGRGGEETAALDAAGHTTVSIRAYSAKYASGLYGPFRDAVDCAIVGGGDRKAYQQDWRNGAREALLEVHADLAQGADMVMVKPALAYLDIIAAVRAQVNVPVAAYHVSGEYAMLKAAAANGWIDHDVVATEHLTAIKRAGADVILTYLTRWFAEANS
jgi:hypothetical protein